jgi:hypothetical protein
MASLNNSAEYNILALASRCGYLHPLSSTVGAWSKSCTIERLSSLLLDLRVLHRETEVRWPEAAVLKIVN